MRKMKKFNDSVVSWYQQWFLLIVSAIVIPIEGNSFKIYKDLDWLSWVWMTFAAITYIYTETMRFKALKLHNASALQKLIPLTTLF